MILNVLTIAIVGWLVLLVTTFLVAVLAIFWDDIFPHRNKPSWLDNLRY